MSDFIDLKNSLENNALANTDAATLCLAYIAKVKQELKQTQADAIKEIAKYPSALYATYVTRALTDIAESLGLPDMHHVLLAVPQSQSQSETDTHKMLFSTNCMESEKLLSMIMNATHNIARIDDMEMDHDHDED